MSKILIIAEKPSLAKTIIKAVGGNGTFKDFYENENYIITSQFGHLLELKSIGEYKNDLERDKKWTLDDLPYFPSEFEYKIKNDTGIKQRYNVIKDLIKRPDVTEIVNAGDPDREGETLVNIVIYKIFEELRLTKEVTRVWLDPLTEDKIRAELQKRKPISDTQNLFVEGKTRAYLDWLYGINLTEYNTLKVGKLMNTGRVIIPLVRWVYDRDMQIKNFIPTKYYPITATINKNGKDIKLDFKELKFDSKEQAEYILNELRNKNIKVVDIENKEQIKQPKKLFSLSTLQTYMFQKYKKPISKTLELVQALYEKGYLTYPRTDTEYLSEDEKDKVRNLLHTINNIDLEFRDSKTIFDSSKVESHTAIIITNKVPNIDELKEDERQVYLTVRNRFYANFVKEECVLDKTIVNFSFGEYKTKITGTAVKQQGYLKYENDIGENEIPSFYFNEEFMPELKIEESETTPPSHLSEADLIKLCKSPFKDIQKDSEEEAEANDDEEYKKILEGSMIGTEATRAIMMEKIKNVGYVKVEKNKLIITEYGIKFIQTLEALNENLWKEKTAELNKNLKRIYRGELTSEEVINIAKQELSDIMSKNITIEKFDNNMSKEILGKCPKCNNGNIVENKKGYGCDRWKEGCNFIIWKTIANKNITKQNVKDLLTKSETKELDGFRSKSGKTFSSKLILNDGKIEFKF
ncbi:MAG: topoisomerase C-terminal repeat-containing protein [Clostridia bacterium]|nr:topoisomerase C-terminal repeat-containing protein [Clostridia bacterium]